jgi:hypothetical protein
MKEEKSDTNTNQGTLKIIGNEQKLMGRGKFSSQPSEG